MMAADSAPVLLVLGGTSDIGRACAVVFAGQGWRVQLAGRDADALSREAADIATRTGMAASSHSFDVLDTDGFASFLDALPALPDAVLCAVGLLGDQALAERDPAHAAQVLRTNLEGPALILGLLAERMVARGSGTIIGLSSVAGDRGRASNAIYGAAKAGFSAFLSGLRQRCARHGVHVVTIKPGFVRTRMTAHLTLPRALTAEPAEVARAVFAATTRRRSVVYSRGIWRLVMLVIRAIPEPIFKRTRL
ncbi:SDR family oxidoreductase [Zavarzinia sp. CC-PAN008]|uniref:SDR family oxidoreductase n=1 Tax=Zavarzinia sp. CC-PAN008 TaxID=3243332 RepID=UPI003F747A9A